MMESLDQELNMLRSKVILTTVCPYVMDSNSTLTKNMNTRFVYEYAQTPGKLILSIYLCIIKIILPDVNRVALKYMLKLHV